MGTTYPKQDICGGKQVDICGKTRLYAAVKESVRPVCGSVFGYGFQNGLNRTVSVLRERLCRNSYFMDSPRVVRAHKKVEDRTLGAWTTLRSRASESERREKNTHNETKRAGTARGFRSDYKWKDQRESNSGEHPARWIRLETRDSETRHRTLP